MKQPLTSKYTGDEVYVCCTVRLGASSAGTFTVESISFKFDEDTGEKYKVLHAANMKWDTRTGDSIPKGMFYLD